MKFFFLFQYLIWPTKNLKRIGWNATYANKYIDMRNKEYLRCHIIFFSFSNHHNWHGWDLTKQTKKILFILNSSFGVDKQLTRIKMFYYNWIQYLSKKLPSINILRLLFINTFSFIVEILGVCFNSRVNFVWLICSHNVLFKRLHFGYYHHCFVFTSVAISFCDTFIELHNLFGL